MNLPTLKNKPESKTILEELIKNKCLLDRLLPIITNEQTKRRNDSIDTVIGKKVGDFKQRIEDISDEIISKIAPSDMQKINILNSDTEKQWNNHHALHLSITLFLSNLIQKSLLESIKDLPRFDKTEIDNTIKKTFPIMILPLETIKKLPYTNDRHDFLKSSENITYIIK